MNINDLSKETFLYDNVLKNFNETLSAIKSVIVWDNSINSRKTASFGTPYNYSNINYAKVEIPFFLNDLIKIVNKINGFIPNNCLINYYLNKYSKMGYHSDQINILYEKTGVAIFSFGGTRILRFKNKVDNCITYDFYLKNNSYFYMSQEVQKHWVHSILPDDSDLSNERFSITFRKIKE